MESRVIKGSHDEYAEETVSDDTGNQPVDISHEQLDPLLYQISEISNQPANNQEKVNLPDSLEFPSPADTSPEKLAVNASKPTAPPHKRQ
ncbi:hypothetical protein MW887_005361 [Aspergillus wentii]|nr:hypothetical protein MW887_005361 [Aspergillus wentii]